MRRAARIDANQAEITEALRKAGASVQPLHMVGRGCPDLLVGVGNINLLFEVKDGEKPPSKQQLTEDERKWAEKWKGQVAVIRSVDEALEAIGDMSVDGGIAEKGPADEVEESEGGFTWTGEGDVSEVRDGSGEAPPEREGQGHGGSRGEQSGR